MTAHFDEFEEEMTSRSLERAYDYVDEHRIGGLEEVLARTIPRRSARF